MVRPFINGIRDLALFPLSSVIPIDLLRDITCKAGSERLKKISQDRDIPYEEKKIVDQFFKTLNADLTNPN